MNGGIHCKSVTSFIMGLAVNAGLNGRYSQRVTANLVTRLMEHQLLRHSLPFNDKRSEIN